MFIIRICKTSYVNQDHVYYHQNWQDILRLNKIIFIVIRICKTSYVKQDHDYYHQNLQDLLCKTRACPLSPELARPPMQKTRSCLLSSELARPPM